MSTTTIFGIHPVQEALRGQVSVEKIWLLKEGKHHKDIISLAKKINVNVSFVPHQKFRKFQSKNHQGVVAFLSPVEFADFEVTITEALGQRDKPIFLLLDGITDVRNVGSILRTAECVGVSAVVIPQQGSARINEDMVKTSAGAIFNIPICKVSHLKDAVFFLKAHDINVIGASEKATKSLFDSEIKTPVAVVMGSEGVGIQKGLLKMLDEAYKLPIKGNTQSLNVSVAAGLFMYELIR